MELNAPDGMLLVPNSHNFILLCMGGDFEARRQGVGGNNEGVVPGSGKGLWHVLKEMTIFVQDRRGFPMHQPVCPDNFPSVGLTNALMPQADPEERFFPLPAGNGWERYAGAVRVAGARRQNNTSKGLNLDIFKGSLIVSDDRAGCPALSKILNQIIGKGVEIINDEEFFHSVQFRDIGTLVFSIFL